ncbi:MAG TPA: helix-turn-helix transcriptional regulator [Candidatus Angelobacter sp.]|nr:helix-turn-helix transcriptional regulator [Candidatus Angelobacter sp.]
MSQNTEQLAFFAQVTHEANHTQTTVVISTASDKLISIQMPQQFIFSTVTVTVPPRPKNPERDGQAWLAALLSRPNPSHLYPPKAELYAGDILRIPLRLQGETESDPIQAIAVSAAIQMAALAVQEYCTRIQTGATHNEIADSAGEAFLLRLCDMTRQSLQLVEVIPPPGAKDYDRQALRSALGWLTTIQCAYIATEFTNQLRDHITSWSTERLSEFLFPPTIETAVPVQPSPATAPQQDQYLTVMSNMIYHGVREALAFNTFKRVEDSPYPTASLNKGTARGHAQLLPATLDHQAIIPPEEAQALVQRMWQQQQELSDLDADALDALSATWLAQARSPDAAATVKIDDLLRMRGLKPKQGSHGRRGGYEPEQRQAMLYAIWHIQNLWLNMAEVEIYDTPEPGKRRRMPRRQAIQSRAFVITDLLGQHRLDGNMDVEQFIFRPGSVFGAFLMGAGRQTALLSSKALSYAPDKEVWEKRLTRYLSWQWRCQAHSNNFRHPYRIITLIEAAGEQVNRRYPSRTKDRLEKALDRLLADGVISGWQYDAQWNEQVVGNAGWSESWLQTTVLLEPPESICAQYRSIAAFEAPKPRRRKIPAAEPPPATSVPNALTTAVKLPPLGEQVRHQRTKRNMSQLQLATQLGITRAYLSMIETGKVKTEAISAALSQKIQAWLE